MGRKWQSFREKKISLSTNLILRFGNIRTDSYLASPDINIGALSWIRGVALLIYGGQDHIEHYLPLEQGHPTTSDPSTILLREYQLVLKVPIGTAPSKIQREMRV